MGFVGERGVVRAWPRPTPIAARLALPSLRSFERPPPEDRAVMARTFVYLFGSGAALLAATIVLPGAPDRELLPLTVVAGIAFAIAVGVLLGFDRTPLWLLRALPAVATGLIAVIVWAGGASLVGAYGMYFFWVVLASCYLFGLRLALFHSGLAIAVCVGVVALRVDVTLPGQRGLLAVGTLVVAAGLVIALRARVSRLIAELDRAAGTDPLTGVLNRRRYEERFAQEIERYHRTGRPVALISADLDHFKRVNDGYGHQAGDRVLREFAAILVQETRAIDVVARLGGDEFVVLAPETEPAGAAALAQRLRRRVGERFRDRPVPLTLSCGVAVMPGDAAAAGQLSRSADLALYRAKTLGRDLVALAQGSAIAQEDSPSRSFSSTK